MSARPEAGERRLRSPGAGCDLPASGPFVPQRYVVVGSRPETADVVTITLEPLDGAVADGSPGQFNMLTAFGRGEAAISISGARPPAYLEHTVRAVGPVSAALAAA